MGFQTLEQWMKKLNSEYYKNSKTKIYDDFLTYAQTEKGKLTKANAIDFYNHTKNNPKDEYKILECGVGNGAFAKDFLKTIHKLDKENNKNSLKNNLYFSRFLNSRSKQSKRIQQRI